VESILAKALGEDVTRLAAAEKQLLLSRLLARLAHEIRNPLSSLDIHVQLLEEDLTQILPQASDKLAGRLEIIHGELHRLENIVKQFLRLAGPSALDLTPVKLDKVIGHVAELLKPEAAKRGIEILVAVRKELRPLLADPDQLIQAFLNLVINALQAVERQGRVEINAREDADFIDVRVRDTGPGVSPEKLSAIFEPYFTTKADGSGIGLWIAQQILTAHGGTIQAGNAPEGGALFTVRLPIRHE
jgi:two-component system sensor histidine kinase HydH